MMAGVLRMIISIMVEVLKMPVSEGILLGLPFY